MRAAIQTNLSFDPLTRQAHPDGLIRAKEHAEKGLCIFCEDPVEHSPTGRKRIVCRKRGCYRAYHRAYGRDRRRQPFNIATELVTRTFRAIAANIEELERLAPQAPK